jgi:hypothetical protein
MAERMDAYTEVAAKRAFAGALDWPGWCRSGRGDEAALEALIAYGPRYAQVLQSAGIKFTPPADVSELSIVERLEGDATTNFGAPSVAPAADARLVNAGELARLKSILDASWTALGVVAETAEGQVLRSGPRGGGRDLAGIYGHVVRAEANYVRKIGGSTPAFDVAGRDDAVVLRGAVADALERAVHEGIPERGPRGGATWGLRYFVRRATWHVLDHVWEIEDRSEPA